MGLASREPGACFAKALARLEPPEIVVGRVEVWSEAEEGLVVGGLVGSILGSVRFSWDDSAAEPAC